MNKFRRNVIFATVVALLALSVGLVAAELIPTADELMLSAVETMENVEDGHAIVTFIAETPEENFSGTVEMWGQRELGPNGEPGLRLEVLAAPEPEMVGIVAVTDGTQFWLYNPAENMVIVGTAEEMAAVMAEHAADFDGDHGDELPPLPEDIEIPETPEEAIALLLEYFTAERNGGEMIAESDAYRIRLIPIPEKMPDEARAAGGFLNLWLRESDQLPLAIEYAEGAVGYARVEATLAEVNIGLDPATFFFEIPEGATVVRAVDLLNELEEHKSDMDTVTTEIELLEATELPADAVPADLQSIAGIAVQRYDRPDGLTFVVAQGPVMPFDVPAEAVSETVVAIQGVEGTLYANVDGNRVMLLWQVGDTMFAVGGDLSAEEALMVARSLE